MNLVKVMRFSWMKDQNFRLMIEQTMTAAFLTFQFIVRKTLYISKLYAVPKLC
jgi:hypothetical protein